MCFLFLATSFPRQSPELTEESSPTTPERIWDKCSSSENLYLFLPPFLFTDQIYVEIWVLWTWESTFYSWLFEENYTFFHLTLKERVSSKGRNHIAIHWKFAIQQTVQFREPASPLICNTDCETLSFWYHLLCTVSLHRALDPIEFGSGVTIWKKVWDSGLKGNLKTASILFICLDENSTDFFSRKPDCYL